MSIVKWLSRSSACKLKSRVVAFKCNDQDEREKNLNRSLASTHRDFHRVNSGASNYQYCLQNEHVREEELFCYFLGG